MRSNTYFTRAYDHEYARIIPAPNNPGHPCRFTSLDDLEKGELAARQKAATRRYELDAVGGWRDDKQDTPEVGARMGIYSAALRLLDVYYNARCRNFSSFNADGLGRRTLDADSK